MMKSNKISSIIMLIIIVFISCKKENQEDLIIPATPYEFKIPKGFPTNPNIPKDNPMTVEGVELGRYLYYDERMSGKADQGMGMSCSSCHLQQFAFENGMGRATGTTGLKTDNVMLPHINLAWNPGTFGWNGSVPSIEDDIDGVVEGAVEFVSTWPDVVKAISAVPEYPAMFNAAFGTPEINPDRIKKAIAQFVRTLISSDTKLDRVNRGEENFTPSERNGLVLFTTESGADCFHCHGASGNPLMTTNLFYNNAKDTIFDKIGDRYSVTGDSRDIGAYKATTLRNIEVTGPYMHDGRFKTLDEVINFYNEGLQYSEYVHPLMHKVYPPYGHGAALNPAQKADLKAFLLCLTDTVFLNNPDYSDPFTAK